jgi:hypothetical protein
MAFSHKQGTVRLRVLNPACAREELANEPKHGRRLKASVEESEDGQELRAPKLQAIPRSFLLGVRQSNGSLG